MTPTSTRVVVLCVALSSAFARAEDRQAVLQTFVKLRTQSDVGSGFVIGIDGDELIVATVHHLVAPDRIEGPDKRIAPTFYPRDLRAPETKATCTLAADVAALDLAFLRCSCPTCLTPLRELSFARAANLSSARIDSPVTIVGGVTQTFVWSGNNTLKSVGAPRQQVLFSSPTCDSGFSGGPVLDDDWNIVGMITGINPEDHEPPLYLALRIDDLIAAARAQRLEVDLAPGVHRARDRDRFIAVSLELGAAAFVFHDTARNGPDLTGPVGVALLHFQAELIPFGPGRFGAFFLNGGAGYQFLRSLQLLRSPVGPEVARRYLIEHDFVIEGFVGARLGRQWSIRPDLQLGARAIVPFQAKPPRLSFVVLLGVSGRTAPGPGARFALSGGLEAAFEEAHQYELQYTGDGATLASRALPVVVRLGVRVGVPLWF